MSGVGRAITISYRKIPVLTPFNDYTYQENSVEMDIMEVLRSGKLSQGEWVKKFEEKLANYLRVSPNKVVAVNSGTSALHIAVDLVFGNENRSFSGGATIDVPAITFVATHNAIKNMGHHPWYIDIDEKTWNASVMNGIGVDLYGNPSEKISVISDACESLGATYNGVKCGTISAVNCLSFFENKPITTGGEGGALVLFNGTLIDEARRLRTQGMLHEDAIRIIPAYNYRMTEIQALIGYYQLDYLDNIIEEKRRIHKTYVDILGDKVQFQEPTEKSNPSWFLNCVKFDSVRTKQNVEKILKLHGIETRDVFEPPHMFGNLPNSEYLYFLGLCLPSGPELPDEDIKRTCELICECL